MVQHRHKLFMSVGAGTGYTVGAVRCKEVQGVLTLLDLTGHVMGCWLSMCRKVVGDCKGTTTCIEVGR